jgi:hypothetical protein
MPTHTYRRHAVITTEGSDDVLVLFLDETDTPKNVTLRDQRPMVAAIRATSETFGAGTHPDRLALEGAAFAAAEARIVADDAVIAEAAAGAAARTAAATAAALAVRLAPARTP